MYINSIYTFPLQGNIYIYIHILAVLNIQVVDILTGVSIWDIGTICRWSIFDSFFRWVLHAVPPKNN